MTEMSTARDFLSAGRTVSVYCNRCQHRATADLEALVEAGRGDEPMARLPWRCAVCESRRTGLIVRTMAWQLREAR